MGMGYDSRQLLDKHFKRNNWTNQDVVIKYAVVICINVALMGEDENDASYRHKSRLLRIEY